VVSATGSTVVVEVEVDVVDEVVDVVDVVLTVVRSPSPPGETRGDEETRGDGETVVRSPSPPGEVVVVSSGLQHGSIPSSVAMQAGRPLLSVKGRPWTESQQQQSHTLDIHSSTLGCGV